MSKTDTGINIAKVEIDSADGIVVTFSDGTATGYVVEELLNLRPKRLPVEYFSRPPDQLQV